ncbi:MAG: outer membrane beta-barrel protein [Pelobium sp.]
MKNLFSLLLILISLNGLAQQADSTRKDTLASQKLMEVVVKSTVPIVQVKTDKISLNVEAMPNAAGTNALELLRQAPGISIDGNDNIKMSGKNGIQVLLDGRLQTLSSQQIASLLKSTDASNIKTIEVIANPSAKYDVAGNAGIVNIIFKKSNQYGTNGSVTLGYQKMQHYRQNTAFNINTKGKNFNAFANGNYDHSLQYTNVESNRYLSDKTFLQKGVERQGYENPGLRFGMDYNLNAKSKIGAILNYNRIWNDFPSDASTQVINGNSNNFLNTITTANLTENKLGSNVNYQFQDASGRKLSIDADWLGYNANLKNSVNNTFSNSTAINTFKNNTKSNINLFSAKVDLNLKFLKDGTFEGGIKFSSSKTENNLKAYQNNGSQELNQNNDYNYKEKIYATYTSFNKSYNKWNLQAGLRAEFTQNSGISVNGQQNSTALSDSSYLNIFPTLFIRYNANENHSFGFSYNKRLNRPSFQDQNPYIYRTDFYYAEQGNPNLLPAYTQSFGLDFTWKGQTQIKLNYNQTKNLMEKIITQNGDQTLARYANAGTRSFVNINVNSPFEINKTWSGYFYVEPYYQFYKADLSQYNGLAKIANGGLGFNSYISNNFNFGKNWTGSLSNWFNYASRSSIYKTKAITSVDVAVKKQMLNNKITLNLAYRDIFNTQRWAQTAQIDEVNQSSLRKWESSGAYVGLSYRFGNQKLKVARGRDTQTEEKDRIKSRN